MATGSISREETLPQHTSDIDSDDSTHDPNYEQTSSESGSESSNEINLLSLPEDILIMILKFVPLEDLLQKVAPVSKELHRIVNSHSILWRCFEEFSVDVMCFNEDQFRTVMSHSACFIYFELPYAVFDFDHGIFNEILSSQLSRSKKMHTLNLTETPINSLQFLQNMTNLRILQLDGCRHLESAEFLNIGACQNLDFLYEQRGRSRKKVADVVSLLPYIPPVYSEYFNTLTSVRKNDLRNEEEDNFCID